MNDFSFPFPIQAAAAVSAAINGFPVLRAAIDANVRQEEATAMRAGHDLAVDIKTYRCILADPPWAYRNGGNGAAKNHYPTMTTAALKALPVSRIAARDAVLLLWATWPMLPDALALIEAWDFTYVTGLPWVKLRRSPTIGADDESAPRPSYGTGIWVRGCSEAVLIARRGQARPSNGNYLGLLSDRLTHSRKPDSVYELAEGLVPLAQEPEPPHHLEMFARRRRPGRDAFGHVEGSITMLDSKGTL